MVKTIEEFNKVIYEKLQGKKESFWDTLKSEDLLWYCESLGDEYKTRPVLFSYMGDTKSDIYCVIVGHFDRESNTLRCIHLYRDRDVFESFTKCKKVETFKNSQNGICKKCKYDKYSSIVSCRD